MKISIIIVHFNGEAFLRDCIGSIPAVDPKAEVIVVDNGSNAETKGRILEAHPLVDWITNEKNLGFGKAANRGAEHASGDILLFVNQDILFLNDTLQELISSLQDSADKTIWGGQLIDQTEKPIGCCGPFPTLANWLGGLFKPKAKRHYYRSPKTPGSEVDRISGAFFAIKKHLFEKLKGFDEKFFMYYEDSDLCKRATEFGFNVRISGARAIHRSPIESRSSVNDDLMRSIRYAQLLYFQKHRPAFEYRILLIITRLYFFLRAWKFRRPYL